MSDLTPDEMRLARLRRLGLLDTEVGEAAGRGPFPGGGAGIAAAAAAELTRGESSYSSPTKKQHTGSSSSSSNSSSSSSSGSGSSSGSSSGVAAMEVEVEVADLSAAAAAGDRERIAATTASSSRQLTAADLSDLARAVYVGGGAQADDMIRWYAQGFEFTHTAPEGEPSSVPSSVPVPVPVSHTLATGSGIDADAATAQLLQQQQRRFPGLKQGQGGPCGVLAAVQAEMVANICFPASAPASAPAADSDSGRGGGLGFPPTTAQQREESFAQALVDILVRAAAGGSSDSGEGEGEGERAVSIRLVHSSSPSLPFVSFAPCPDVLTVLTFRTASAAKQYILTHLHQFFCPRGCLLFLLALVLTRGAQQIAQDMDQVRATARACLRASACVRACIRVSEYLISNLCFPLLPRLLAPYHPITYHLSPPRRGVRCCRTSGTARRIWSTCC